MKNWKSFIAVLIFQIGPIISFGQYTFALKGQKSEYDSAVIVRLDRYRLETRKLKTADKLVDSLVNEIRSITLENYKADSSIAILKTENKILIQSRKEDRETIKNISLAFDGLVKTEERNWFQRFINHPVTWFVTGSVLTAIVLK